MSSYSWYLVVWVNVVCLADLYFFKLLHAPYITLVDWGNICKLLIWWKIPSVNTVERKIKHMTSNYHLCEIISSHMLQTGWLEKSVAAVISPASSPLSRMWYVFTTEIWRTPLWRIFFCKWKLWNFKHLALNFRWCIWRCLLCWCQTSVLLHIT